MTTFRLSNLDAELHAGDIGTEIILTLYDITEVDGELVQDTPLDLTGLTVTMFLCRKEGIVEKTTEVVGLVTTGTIKAVTEEGDLVAGRMTIQCLVEQDSGPGKWHTGAVSKRVHAVCKVDE